MKIIPIGEKIILRINVSPEEIVSGGIIIKNPEKRDRFRDAVIYAVGPRYKGELRPGDEVLCPPYIGTEHIINKERLVFTDAWRIPAARDN